MKEKIDKIIWWIEMFFVNKITYIIIVLLFVIIVSSIFCIISIEYTFTTIWAILAFWYWYMKHNRQKELEMYEKYEIWDMTIENMDNISKWKKSYYLYEKWYLSSNIFELINSDNNDILIEFIDDQLYIKEWEDEKSIIKRINIIWNRLSQFTSNEWFYKNMENTLTDYSNMLLKIIKLDNDKKDKEKYTIIQNGLSELIKAMKHWEQEVNKLNT